MTRRDVRSQYDVVSRVGAGAIFTAYKARDRSTNQAVVFKVLSAHFSENAQFLTNLQAAALSAARLPHPAFARVYSAGEEEGAHYVLTEFISGVCLEDRLAAEAPLPQPEVLRLALQIAEGLAYVHQNGLAHADLRPQQVLITPRGEARITDLALGGALLTAGNLPDDHLLRVVPYMAPEVAAGGAPSPAADQYALGVMLYRMATGKVPFEGLTPAQIARRHAEETPSPPTHLNPALSRPFEDLILRLLAKDPAQRYGSTADLVRDLKSLAAGPASGNAIPSGTAPSDPMLLRSDRFIFAAPAEAEGPTNLGMRVLYGLLIMGLLGVLAVTIAVFFFLIPKTRDVKVPEVVGKSMADARKLIEPLGLTLKQRAREFSDSVPEGQILRADPGAGEIVKEGREIAIDVSDGPNLIDVPDVSELSLPKARQVLVERGLKVGDVIHRFHDTVPNGCVISQTPRGNAKWKRGEPVGLFVSRGPGTGGEVTPDEPTRPPDVADDTVRDINLQVEIPQGSARQQVKIVITDQQGTNTVYEQMHRAGEKVSHTVQVRGKEARLQVYVAGTLVEQDRILPDGRVVKD